MSDATPMSAHIFSIFSFTFSSSIILTLGWAMVLSTCRFRLSRTYPSTCTIVEDMERVKFYIRSYAPKLGILHSLRGRPCLRVAVAEGCGFDVQVAQSAHRKINIYFLLVAPKR